MAFNNLPCTLVSPSAAPAVSLLGLAAPPQQQVAVPQFPAGNATTSLRVQYAPIEFTDLSIGLFAPPFTVIYFR